MKEADWEVEESLAEELNNRTIQTREIPNRNRQMRHLVFLLRAKRHLSGEYARCANAALSAPGDSGWRRSPALTPTWRHRKEAWRSWCWGGSLRHRRRSSSTTETSRTGFRALLQESKQHKIEFYDESVVRREVESRTCSAFGFHQKLPLFE